jgi:hypothetical protein
MIARRDGIEGNSVCARLDALKRTNDVTVPHNFEPAGEVDVFCGPYQVL